jgi:hypothetical protein
MIRIIINNDNNNDNNDNGDKKSEDEKINIVQNNAMDDKNYYNALFN